MQLKLVSDRLALEALFKSTHGEGWENKTGWEDWEKHPDSAIGEWEGVVADDANEGRVTNLSIHNCLCLQEGASLPRL